MTEEGMRALIESVSALPRISGSRPSMYEVARSAFMVQPMSTPAAGVFYLDFYKKCEDPSHGAYGGPLEQCDHHECAVRAVMES